VGAGECSVGLTCGERMAEQYPIGHWEQCEGSRNVARECRRVRSLESPSSPPPTGCCGVVLRGAWWCSVWGDDGPGGERPDTTGPLEG